MLLSSIFQRRFACSGLNLQTYREGTPNRPKAYMLTSDALERECVYVTPPIELLICPICQDVLNDPAITTCGHTFCRNCVRFFFPLETKSHLCIIHIFANPDIICTSSTKHVRVYLIKLHSFRLPTCASVCPLCRAAIQRTERGEVAAAPNLLIKAQGI